MVRSVLGAVGAFLVRAAGEEMLPARQADDAVDVISREAARAARYGWAFTLVMVRFDTADTETVARVLAETSQRLRAGDELHQVGDDAAVLILPAIASAVVPDLLSRVTSRTVPLHFGLATSPDDGVDGRALLSVAEQRLVYASDTAATRVAIAP